METRFPVPRADEYLALLREALPEKTYHHCVSVAAFMLENADAAGISAEQAVTAGLLHDWYKATPVEALAGDARALGVTEYLDNRNLLHGPVAAEACRQRLGILDAAVIDAIRWHTTGHGDWNAVGCALYLADFAEPARTRPEAAEARSLLESEGFDAALRFVARAKTRFTREKHGPNPDAESFVRWLDTAYPDASP